MSKNLNNLKWNSVALDGFSLPMTDKFQGFGGLEECTAYGLEKETKIQKKKKLAKKRKHLEASPKVTSNKKIKLNNGFIVEDSARVTPSLSNEVSIERKPKNNREDMKIQNLKESKAVKRKGTSTENNNNADKSKLSKKKNKLKLGETESEGTSILTPEDMLTWAEFKLPEKVLKALAELGFKQPTKIQQLTLPAAIHGRRDILGAAETGSGKTLAFGLPILSGILKLKEKAEAKGLDVYDIPYKKTSVKKRNIQTATNVNKSKDIKRKNTENLSQRYKTKESSEDGYSSGDESNNKSDSEVNVKKVNGDVMKIKLQNKSKKCVESEDFLEEIILPIHKKESTHEDNNSDDSDSYVHLSELFDSDDLKSSSDEEIDKSEQSVSIEDKNYSNAETKNLNEKYDDGFVVSDDDIDNSGEHDSQSENDTQSGDEDNNSEETDSQNEVDETEEGIGLVKVVDNIEIPGHVTVRTGKPLYALILTPTRELAIQISRHLIAAAKYTGIKIATVVGGMAAVKQERVLRSGPEVVVATPGRLFELLNQGQPHLQQLDSVKFLAIDETDRMIERNHFEELQPLLERLNADEERRSTRQNFVFSATLTLVHDLPAHMRGKKVTKRGKIINKKIEKMNPQQKIKRLIDMIGMTDPKVVDITTQNLGTAETLTECSIACSFDHKDAYLYYILKRYPGRTIVFCNSIGSVKRLAQLMTLLKCQPLPLHANMQQRQRLKNLEKFRDDPHGVLIATDVAARGLDIPNVDHVVHYQVPRTAENYVHRSGRTARANKEGLTILMMEPAEAYSYSKLCRTLNKTSVLPTFPVPGELLTPMRELVNLARQVDALELKKKRAAQSIGWREKAAKDLDMIIDEDDIPLKQMDPSIDKALRAKRSQLNSMLSRPIFPKGFSYKYPTLNDVNALSMPKQNALQVMKTAMESAELKKEKRKGKNESLLKLEKQFRK